mgnify:CR=1 FL=1
MSSWVRHHFEHLRRWREYADKVARSARDLAPGAEVYVIGGVAEGRATVLSDIDVLIVVRGLDSASRRQLSVEILDRAIAVYGLPWDSPVELHVVDEVSFREYLKRCRRVVRVG